MSQPITCFTIYFCKRKGINKKIDEKDMIDKNELSKDIKKIIDEMRSKGIKEVLTTDIIRKHQGNYHNANTSPSKSWNAKFGILLKENQNVLGDRKSVV